MIQACSGDETSHHSGSSLAIVPTLWRPFRFLMASPRRFWFVFVLTAVLDRRMELRRWTDPDAAGRGARRVAGRKSGGFSSSVPLFVPTPVFYGTRGSG